MNLILQNIFLFKRNKLNGTVIILSLALGLACVFLIAVFIQRELNPESFNPDRQRTFALQSNNPFGAVGGEGKKILICRNGSAEYITENFAEVESFCRISNNSIKQMHVNGNFFYEPLVFLTASSNFFDFLNYTLLMQNTRNVLEAKNDIVISSELAVKYFGEENPLGQSVKIRFKNEEKEFFVKGVFERPIAATQLYFDMVSLFEGERNSRCYVKLDSPFSKQNVEKKFASLKNEIPILKSDEDNQYDLLPLKEAYYSSMRRSSYDQSRDKTDLWIAAIVAMLILGIAIFNYLILIKNSLNDYTKSFVIYKIHGATNRKLTQLFMKKTLCMIVIAFVLSLFLIKLFVPVFNQLLTTSLEESVFIQLANVLLGLFFIGIVGLITYFFVYAHIRTQLTLRNLHTNQTIRRKTNAMNIIQLVATIVLVICSSLIIRQIQFINNKKIGLDKNIIEVKIPHTYKNKADAFYKELSANSSVKKLSLTPASPLLEHYVLMLKYNNNGVEDEYYPNLFLGDEHYIETLGINIVEGEGFSGNPEVDQQKCLVNQSLANIFPGQKLIGKPMPGNPEKTIVGIVEDFHFSNLKRKIEPGFIEYSKNGPNILVKATKGLENEVEALISTIWNELIPDIPVNYERLDERYKALHVENKKFIRLIGSFSLISIFLSMMGLFAMSFDKSLKRSKEIGIRKVNGATIWQVIRMLNLDFMKWVAIAFTIAAPMAYYAMHKWLEKFAYKTALSWWIFALAGVLVLLMALLTVSWQSWRAARKNPVEALRYE